MREAECANTCMILNRKKKNFLEGLYNFSVPFHALRLDLKLPTEARSTYVWMKAIVTQRHLVQGIMRQLVPFIFPFLFPQYQCVVITTCSFDTQYVIFHGCERFSRRPGEIKHAHIGRLTKAKSDSFISFFSPLLFVLPVQFLVI